MNSVNNNNKNGDTYFGNNRKFLGRIKFLGTAFVSAAAGVILFFAFQNGGPNFSTNAPEKELDSTKVVTQNTDKEFENRINEDSTSYQIDDNTIAVEDNKTDEKENKGILETIKDVFSNKDKDNEQITSDTNSSNTNNESTTHNEQTNEVTQSENVSPTNNTRNPVTGSIETHVATSRDATLLGVGGEVTFHGDNTATSINAGIDKTISHDPDSKEGLLNVSAGVGNTWYFDNENSVSINVEGDLDISNGGKVNGGGIKAGVSHTTPLGESNNTITYGGFVGYKTDGGAYGGVGATIKFGENKNTPKKTFVNDGDGFKLVEKNASTTPDNPNPDNPSPDNPSPDNPSPSKPNINTPTNPQEPVR